MTVLKYTVWTLVLLLVQFTRATELPVRDARCNEFEDAFNPTHLPYPGDCKKFYKCSGGYAAPMSCPNGLHWSVAYNRCEYPSMAGCDSSIAQVKPRDTSNAVVTSECPISEDVYNPTHLPFPGDCTKFYKCEAGIAYPINCPQGLHWSVALNRCDWPNVAGCSGGKIPTPAPITPAPVTPAPVTSAPVTPAPVTPAPVTPAPVTSAPVTPAPVTPAPVTPAPVTPAPVTPAPVTSAPATPAPVPPTIDVSNLNAYCKSTTSRSGYFAYPGDCKRFIQCSNGKGYVQTCPGTLLYNSKLNGCSRICV